MRRVSILVSLFVLCTGCSFLSSSDNDEPNSPEATEPALPPLVKRWPHQLDTTPGDYASIEASTVSGEVIFAAGSFTTVEDRTQAPYLVELSATNEPTETFLPKGDAQLASISAVHVDDSNVLAAGVMTTNNKRSAAVWNKSGDEWTTSELPSDGEQPHINGISPDGQYIFGGAIVDTFDRPQLWKRSGDNWELVTVETGGGDATDHYLSAMTVTSSGSIIGVGSFVNGRFKSPLTWVVDGDLARSEQIAVEGFEFGELNDVATTASGKTIAVGVRFNDGFSTPFSLSQPADGGAWSGAELPITESGRSVSGGLAAGKITTSGSSIYVSFSQLWVNDPLVSTDDGATWQSTELIASGSSAQGTDDAIFEANNERLLVGNEVNLVERSGSSWTRLAPDLLKSNSTEVLGTKLLEVDGKLTIAGTTTNRAASGILVPVGGLWTSTLEEPWQQQKLDGGEGTYISSAATNGEFTVYTGQSDVTGNGTSSVIVESATTITPRPPDRILFSHTLVDESGALVASGTYLEVSDASVKAVPLLVQRTPGENLQIIDNDKIEAEEPTLTGLNQESDCLTRNDSGYLSISSDETGQMIAGTSTDGINWKFGPTTETIGQIASVTSCHRIGSEVALVGTDNNGNWFIERSGDLATWSSTAIGTRNDSLNEIIEIDGQLFAVGSRGGSSTKTSGQVWYEKGEEWVPLENAGSPTGFEPDDLANQTTIWQALEYGDDVVFFGSDVDRIGLWTIPKADLLAKAK